MTRYDHVSALFLEEQDSFITLITTKVTTDHRGGLIHSLISILWLRYYCWSRMADFCLITKTLELKRWVLGKGQENGHPLRCWASHQSSNKLVSGSDLTAPSGSVFQHLLKTKRAWSISIPPHVSLTPVLSLMLLIHCLKCPVHLVSLHRNSL